MNKKSTEENGGTKWATMLLIFGTVVCTPVAGILVWRVSQAITDEDARLLLGVVVAAGLFVANTAILSLFISAYSRLRRTEEDEDDKREMDLMRIMLGQRPDTRYNYTIKPGQPVPYQVPFGQTYPPVEAPPKIEYVDDELTLGG